jgi:hypothetical protein
MVRLGEVIVRGPSVHEPANVLARAVDGDDHAACVSGTIGCQKDGHVGYFAWSCGAPERELLHQFAIAVFIAQLVPGAGGCCLQRIIEPMDQE